MPSEYVDNAGDKETAYEKAIDLAERLQAVGVHKLVAVRKISEDNWFIETWVPEMPEQRGENGENE